MIDFTKNHYEELWASYESIVHANFALNNNVKLIHRMIEQGLIDGNVEVGKKHAISLNNVIEQMQVQIKRNNEAAKQIKNILNSLKDEDNC